jgi:drug/metabolite transporter (DMT)-like permease
MNGNAVWQSQTREAPRISLQFVRRQAERINSDIRRETRMSYFGTAFCIALGLFVVFAPVPAWSVTPAPAAIVVVIQLTALLSALACIYTAFQIRLRGKLQRAVEHEQVMQSLQAYRAALERRRDHYATAWRWALWPVMPAVVTILGGTLVFDERPHKWLRLGLAAAVCLIALLLSVWVSSRKSAWFRKELDALQTLEENPS